MLPRMASNTEMTSSQRAVIGYSSARLMEYSEQYLQLAAQAGACEEATVATRLMQDVPLYRMWEQSHGRLMRGVAARRRRSHQSAAGYRRSSAPNRLGR